MRKHTWQSGFQNTVGKSDRADPPAPVPLIPCPECGSDQVWKDGLRYVRRGNVPIQRLLCRKCGFRYSESSRPVQNVDRQILNSTSAYVSTRRVCAADGAVTNLVEVETRTMEKAAGATLTPLDFKGKLVEFTWFMRKEGYASSTIKCRREIIQTMINRGMGPQLLNPDAIKSYIAKQSWDSGFKRNAVHAYTTFLAMHGKSWSPPHYKQTEKLPFIPLESEINQLITTTGKRMSIFLQGLKETGADPGELFALEWIDINPQTRNLTINHPVKGHNPRILRVSRDLIDRMNTLPKTEDKVFRGKIESLRRNYQDQRKTAARKFNNPRFLKIKLITFRHWKGTWEYHKTKDVYHVKKLLGHKSLRSTEIYINLEQAVFDDIKDEYVVKVAATLDEASKLLEVGFEYVTDMDGKKLFRKPKDYTEENKLAVQTIQENKAEDKNTHSTAENTPVWRHSRRVQTRPD